MNHEVRELNDAELEAVSGGMTCETACVVSNIHQMTAIALGVLGNNDGAQYFSGLATGVFNGGCK
ncbi:hypothetical protein LJR220_003553 [Bradyrhizobium sp. LjRoot220]|uniref:hypothetical protein n=1 Tax=Bradyrhizobium sp. LjRoot220 TaxID=3342284 RepID=UPI003ECF3B67